ncbi:hypothetical protein HBH53_085690 [Parastagonospora nodorum]|nr:hypothetical protein HBH53_085690 [Parastagonospora nodorum]KAH4195171.1 hypothetical protein HBH42_089880 [Parastagonospora nodorum]KAH5764391.1 hypothetical protein HBI17_039270 [Parastagonospora nodorum]KAH6429963.1 hypothetical protein HBI14_048240 [Parastagonospora nodorum]
MSDSSWHFEAQRGFFSHDNDPETWKFRAFTQPSLGLLGRSYPTDDEYWAKQGGSPGDPAHSKWPRFQHYLTYLNAKNSGQEKYKMLYIVRHGQGVHNVVEEEVGRDEWNRYWAKVPGDDSRRWLDADLTPHGEQQATDISSLWVPGGVDPPRSIYTSPLRRCLQTTQLGFAPLIKERVPVIKERLRERLGVHTCDQRSSKTWITSTFPEFRIEDGFAEKDEFWKAEQRETIDQHAERAKELLSDLFDNDENQTIALVAHSGALMALFKATGWGKIPVQAGAVYPLLVRGTRAN